MNSQSLQFGRLRPRGQSGCGVDCCRWQAEDEAGAGARIGIRDDQFPALGTGEPARQREAQADAGLALGGFAGGFVERLENPVPLGRRNAGAVVEDVDGHPTAGFGGADFNFGWCTAGGVFGGVVNEIEEDVVDCGKVGAAAERSSRANTVW